VRANAKACRSGALVRRAIAKDHASEGLPFVTLTNTLGDTAKVYTFGANVASYVKGGNDVLALRKDNVIAAGKPVAGGIPICFPQFGPGPYGPQHGFARSSTWAIAETADGLEPKVVLKLCDNAETRSQWDHPFEATYTVTLKDTHLETVLSVKNTGSTSFDFTAALHSYWSVSAIADIKVVGGFAGKTYLNRIEDPQTDMVNSAGNELTISEATDHVYKGLPCDLMLEDSGKASTLAIHSTGFSDTVVWNPFGNEKMGYDSFVCLEAAQSSEPVILAPAEEWVGTMSVQPTPK